MVMAAAQQLSAEAFAAMRAEGKRYDLVRGKLLEVRIPVPMHGLIQASLAMWIAQFVESRELGMVTIGSGFILARNPDTVRGPDVAFTARQRLVNQRLDTYLPFGPDLAVEVIARGDDASDLMAKIGEYFRAGTRLVWVVYPELKCVYVYNKPTVVRVIYAEGVLDGGDVLPDFEISVSSLFEELEA